MSTFSDPRVDGPDRGLYYLLLNDLLICNVTVGCERRERPWPRIHDAWQPPSVLQSRSVCKHPGSIDECSRRQNTVPGARHIVPRRRYRPGLPHNHSTMEQPPRNPGKVIEFSQPHDAVARMEAFVGRLIESGDLLTSALVRLRDFYLAGAPPMVADKVLAQVEAALEMAARTRNGF